MGDLDDDAVSKQSEAKSNLKAIFTAAKATSSGNNYGVWANATGSSSPVNGSMILATPPGGQGGNIECVPPQLRGIEHEDIGYAPPETTGIEHEAITDDPRSTCNARDRLSNRYLSVETSA